jgi:hypothetical protein
MKTIVAFRDFSSRLSGGLGNSLTQGRAAMKKRWRRSWPGRVAWPWLRSELEIVAKVAGVVTRRLLPLQGTPAGIHAILPRATGGF